MDTGLPISHPSSPEVPPDFPHNFPPPLSSSALHTSSSHALPPAFPNQADHPNVMGDSLPVHVPSPDPTAFIDPLAALEPAAAMNSAQTEFMVPSLSNFTTPVSLHNDPGVEAVPSAHSASVSPSHQHLPSVSPPIHTSGAGFTPSSLQDALDPTVSRSRANTVSSPVPVVAGGPVPAMLTAFPNSTDALSFPLANASVLLKQIAENATSGSIACQANQGNEAKPYLDNIKQQLTEVFNLIDGISLEDRVRHPAQLTPPATSAIPADVRFGLQDPRLIAEHPDSDSSRKRCASSLQEERPVKALKSEPPDDILLVDNYAPSVVNALRSPPSSRPPSPFNFSLVKQQPPSSGFSFVPPNAPSLPPTSAMDMSPYLGSGQLPPVVPQMPLTMPPFRSSFSESAVPTRHSHSLSTGSIGSSTAPGAVPSNFGLPGNNAGVIGRMNRSGSINGTMVKSYQAPYLASTPFPESWAMSGMPTPSSEGSFTSHSLGSSVSLSSTSSGPTTWLPPHSHPDLTPPEEDGGDDSEGGDEEEARYSPSSELPSGTSSSGSDVPLEYRTEVDRIFFEFLNRICSNLEATDSKGEAIHQTLMAKKMQRLDESKDFRPFKFRIQAFTHAFLEELARQGYPEEKIPMKKVRNYLWRQHYILRFNEDGKKAKSKGNHIWNIEAKKAGDGKWEFRPFYRKLAGTPPSVAYCGLRWSWTARIWDPQASWQNVPVQYSSPSLPRWLSWKDDVLSGIPPPDAVSCDITAVARFVLDGQESQLTHSFRVNVHPAGTTDPLLGRLSRELPRSVSDTMIFKGQPRPAPRTEDVMVQTVLQDVAQLVTEQAHSQMLNGGTLPEVAKQRHVIEQTVSAVGQVLNGPTPTVQTKRLAAAASEVVAEAALTAVAPRVPPSYPLAIRSASVPDMVHYAQRALAAAVQCTGPSSTDNTVEVVNTAKDLLVNSRASSIQQQQNMMPLLTEVSPNRNFHHVSNHYVALPVSDIV